MISTSVLSSWVNLMLGGYSVPACYFDAKLAAAHDELLVFQHIQKSTRFEESDIHCLI